MKRFVMFFCFILMSTVQAYSTESVRKQSEAPKAEADVFPNPTQDFITIKLSKLTDQPINLKI